MHKPRLSDTFTIRSSPYGCSRARPYGLMRSESLLRLRTSTPCQVRGCGCQLPAWTGSLDSIPVCIETTRFNTPQSRGQYWCEGRGQHATSSTPFYTDTKCLLVSHLILVAARRKCRAFSVRGLPRYHRMSKSPTAAFDTPTFISRVAGVRTVASAPSLLEALDDTGTRNEAFIACRREYFDFSTTYYNRKTPFFKHFLGIFRDKSLIFAGICSFICLLFAGHLQVIYIYAKKNVYFSKDTTYLFAVYLQNNF